MPINTDNIAGKKQWETRSILLGVAEEETWGLPPGLVMNAFLLLKEQRLIDTIPEDGRFL